MPRYHIRFTAYAIVTGSLSVTAETAKDAANLALNRQGEILWQYQGLDDSRSLEFDSIEEDVEDPR